jgi:hypothetical protein
VIVATVAHAADNAPPSSVESPLEVWTAAGRPGWVSDFHMGTGLPWNYLGLVAGGVTFRDGVLPNAARPWPGIDEIVAPRTWYDSTAVVVGEGGGWRGFSASLVDLQAIATPPIGRRPRAALSIVNGSSAVDRNGLMISRGGDRSWVRVGALDEERSGSGILGQRGQHVWFGELGRRYGPHAFSISYAQRGVAGGTRFVDQGLDNPTPPYSGFTEDAHGESGALNWRWETPARSVRVELSRSHDHRESSELQRFDPFLDAVVYHLFAEREAEDDGALAEVTFRKGERSRGLRLELRQSEVRRSVDVLNGFVEPAHDVTQQTAWLAAREQRPLAKGTLELQLGGGHVDTPGDESERWQLAPSATWRIGPAERRLRLYAERVVTPVWSDLAPGVLPFVQDSWVAGADVNLGVPTRQWIEVGGLAAEIGNRAWLQLTPVRDIALRYGWSADLERVQDAMLTVATGVRRGAWALEASGFSRVRPQGSQPAKVDPALGARVRAETGFRAFTGDLGVLLRVEAAYVGERENESLPEYFAPPRPLAGYATWSAGVAMQLGDATLALRATNLEDIARPEAWTDPSSPFPGVPADGSGRQYRFEVSWPFFN